MERRVSRGVFVARAATAAGGLAALGLTAAPEAQSAPVVGTLFRLDPCGGDHEGSSCSCKACASHAANVVYATAAACDADRPHVGCNCAIATQRVSPGIWTALFRARNTTKADRRHLPRGLAKQF